MDRPVPDDDLQKIIEAGRWAPNSGEFQISVIRNADLRQRINGATREVMISSDREFLRQRIALPGYEPLYGAPVLILFSAPTDNANSALNVALSAESMLLQATELGLGSCFIVSPTLALNKDEYRALAEEAGVPEGYTSRCGVIVGYAAPENKFSLGERTRRGTVTYFD